ncbi:hypothetical protein [Streptomyces sp. NPDC003077]|uniref:hypothetical protein n=1 Tax=Streptomyces sp. NPDC003077 TaxID=3154443 RepID=UPI0033A9AB66
MAYTCPHCTRPNAVAYIDNDSGRQPWPCLFCERSVQTGPAGRARRVSAPCGTGRCHGVVTDAYEYDARARLTAMKRTRCPHCGGDRTAALSSPSGA